MATQYASQSITITASSLSSGSARESASVATDTTVNVADYRVYVKAGVGTGTPAGSKAVYVWGKASDDGTNWTGNATSSDAAITLDSPHQFVLIGSIPITAQSTTRAGSFSLRQAFGGSIPANWGIILENQVGIAFNSLTVACEKEYTS
jgi:hypothetical protein